MAMVAGTRSRARKRAPARRRAGPSRSPWLAAPLLCVALIWPAAGAADWRDASSWQQLRVGMSQFDVLRILGEPGKVTRYYAFERWEYPDALGLRVNFDERSRLIAWGPYAR